MCKYIIIKLISFIFFLTYWDIINILSNEYIILVAGIKRIAINLLI